MAETIEGYRFTVDLDDRGMRTKLSDLAKEARTLKSIMRANFNENMSVGNSYQAFSQKITDANRAIEQYNISIKQAQQDIKELPERLEKAKEEYNKLTDEQKKNSEEGQRLANEMKDLDSRQLSLINKIQNYRNQISSLNRVIADAERHQQNYNRTLEQYRAVSAGMSSAMSSYNRMLEESGMRALTTKGRVSQLTEQHRLLSRQSQLETAQARKLQSSLATLQQKYVSSAAAVRKAADAHGKESDEYKKAASTYSLARSNMETATADMQKQVATSAKVTGQVMKMRSAINSVGTGRLGSVARAFNNIDTRVRAATSHTRAYANSLKGSLMGVSIGVTAFGAGVGKAVSMSMQLQNQWITTKNLLQTGAHTAAEAREEVGKLSTMERDARNYSKEYGYSQKEIAEQYTELVKRGYSASQSIGSMKSMLQAARASGDDYADVVKNVSSTVDAFGIRSNATAIQTKKGTKEATEYMISQTKRVTNAMAYAADMTATDFQDMGEAMSYVSASAHQAGQSVEVTTAAIGELSNAGIEGTRAGTGLRKVFNSLTAPTKGAQEALQQYGMSVDDFKTKSGALKSLPEIMKTINKHTKNLGKADKAAFFKAVFGTTGQQAAMVLAQNAEQMQKLVDAEKKAEKHNYVHQLAEKNMATTQMQLQKLKTSIQDIAITMGNKLLPAINDVVAGFGKWESSKAGQKAIKDFGNAVAGVAKTIGRNSDSIMSFIGGFSEGLLGVIVPVAKFVGWIGKMVGGIGKFFGLSNKAPQAAGIITGALIGIIGTFKLLHTTISGVNAVKDDLKSIGVMKDTTAQLETQNGLYERMIQLQERSLALAEAQAKQQGIDTANLSKNTTAENAESLATDIPTSGKNEVTKDVAKGAESAVVTSEAEKAATTVGGRSGSRFLSAFLLKAKGLTRGLLGLVLPEGFLDLGSKAGSKLAQGIAWGAKKTGSLVMKLLRPIGRLGGKIGKSFASLFVKSAGGIKSVVRYISNSAFGRLVGSLKSFVAKWVVPETWRKAGQKAASLFVRGFKSVKLSRINPKNLFRGTEKAGAEAGSRAGTSMIGSLTSKVKGAKLTGIGAGLAKKIGGPFMIALGAIDIMRAWNTSKHKDRAKNVGGAMGNLAGMAAGGKIGAALGTAAGPIGAAVGGILGAVIGGVAGTKIGKILGPSLAKLWKGTVKTFDLVFKKHDWKGMMNNLGKSWKSFWNGMGNWWDEVIGKKTSHPKKSSSSKSSSGSSHTFKSSGNVKYSKSDIENLKNMTKAIGDYKSALKGLKSYVKNNDPSKQMNSMVSNMSKSVKGWDKLARPIKKIGDAFKTLSKFAGSMAKYDAFKALNDDLPKLESTLSKSKIGDKLKDISSSIKSSHIIGRMQDLTKEVKSDTSKWKDFAKPVKTVGSYMKDFAKALDSMAGKGSSLQSFIGLLPQLSDALTKNDIAGKLKTLGKGIKDSHVVGRLSDLTKELKDDTSKWKAFASPVKTMGSYMKDFQKAISGLSGKNSSLATLNDQIPTLTSTLKKNDLGGEIQSLAGKVKKANLDKLLSGLSGSGKKKTGSLRGFAKDISTLASNLKKFNSQTGNFGGKKDHVSSMAKDFEALQKVLRKQNIGSYLRRMASDIKKSKIDKELSSISKDVKNSAKDWKSLSKPIVTVSKAFKTLNSAVKGLAGSKKSGFTKLTADIKDLYRTVRKYPFGKQIASQAAIANNAMSGKKAGFVGRFTQATNQMTRALRNFGRTFNREWKGTWKGLASPVERELNSAERAEDSRLDAMEDKRSDFSSAFLKGWKSWIDDVVSSFKSGFNKLPEYASSAMKDIVSRLNKGITGINAVIGDFGGDKKLSAISYATGTKGGHPGGHMLVNDSTRPHYKELIKFPGRPWRMFEGKNIFIPNAPKGTQVINGEQTFALNSRGLLPKLGVHAYANGSLSDEEQEKLSEEFENNPQAASKELVLKLTNWSSNVPVVADLGQALAVGFSRGIANVLKDLLGEVKEPVNGDWTPVIKSAAAKMGEHLSDYDIKRILNTINHESGGSEKIPGIDDHDGTGAALGLLQYKRSTFNHYAVAGHTDIFSGFDQLMALFNDTNWRGDLRWNGGWGPTGGRRRANGGLMFGEQLYHIAENNKPEMIIPLDINKRPRALSLIDSTLDTMEHDGGGTGGLHSRSSVNNGETTAYLKQAVAILGQIAGLNAQQIDAIMNINPGTDMKSRRQRSRFYNDYGNDQRIRDYQAF